MMTSSSSAELSSLASTEINRGSNRGEQGSRRRFFADLVKGWRLHGVSTGLWRETDIRTTICHAEYSQASGGSRGLKERTWVEDQRDVAVAENRASRHSLKFLEEAAEVLDDDLLLGEELVDQKRLRLAETSTITTMPSQGFSTAFGMENCRCRRCNGGSCLANRGPRRCRCTVMRLRVPAGAPS